MLKRGLAALFMIISMSLTASAQTKADSVGTIRVKKKEIASPAKAPGKVPIYFIVEQMPSFPNDGMSMSEFIDATFVVPQQAIDRGISGTALVSCIVDASGELANIRIAKQVPNCPDCDAEALRVVNQMPLWVPGRQNGKAVPVMVNIPVRFRFNQ